MALATQEDGIIACAAAKLQYPIGRTEFLGDISSKFRRSPTISVELPFAVGSIPVLKLLVH
jgi:hypothetical protein